MHWCITAHNPKCLTFTGGTHLPHERGRGCKRSNLRAKHLAKAKLRWDQQTPTGSCPQPHRQPSIHHSTFADTMTSQYWGESPVHSQILERAHNSPPLANLTLFIPSIPTEDGKNEDNTGALPPASQALSLGQPGHPLASLCTYSSPFFPNFTYTSGVIQRQELLPTHPEPPVHLHNSSRAIPSS